MDKPTYEELEAQVVALKSELAAHPEGPERRGRPSGWRRLGLGVLIALGCLGLAAADLGLWANRTVISTSGYVAAVSPLAHDPAVQTALVKATQDQIQSNVDITQTVKNALPDQAAFLAGPISTGVTNAIHSFLNQAVRSQRFADAWTNANQRVHQQFMNLVTKYEGNGQITLQDAFSVLSTRLQSTPLATVAGRPLPPKFGDIQILDAAWLPVAHNVVTTLGWIVPVGALVAVAAFGLAIWWSPRRRRTVITAALATAFTLAVVNIAVRLVQQIRQSNIPDADYRAAAQAVSQALLGPLIGQTRVWIVLALLVAAGAWVPGPSRSAVALRSRLRRASATAMNATGNLGAGTPAVGWLRRRRRVVEWSLVALAVVVLMFLTPLSIASVAWTAAILVILIVLIEVVTSTPRPEAGRVAP